MTGDDTVRAGHHAYLMGHHLCHAGCWGPDVTPDPGSGWLRSGGGRIMEGDGPKTPEARLLEG